MKITNGDYVVLDGPKAQLAKVVHAEKPYKATLEKDREREEGKIVPVEFKSSDVIANLGKSPRPGTVHGVKIEPLYRRDDSKFFGSIRVYQDMSDARYKAFRAEMVTFIKVLKKHGLEGVPAELEIRPIQGKYAGYYKHRSAMETDILCVRPNESLDGMQYIFSHEYWHGIWFRMLPKKYQHKWVMLYHTNVSVFNVDDDELVALREEIESIRSIKDFLKDCVPEQIPVIREALKYVQKVHGLSKHHLELMLYQDDSLENVWPTAIDLSDKDMSISDYAAKAPEEYFAEAGAFYFLGRKLPANVQSLMEKSLSSLVRGGRN